jgi:hypothetical protein
VLIGGAHRLSGKCSPGKYSDIWHRKAQRARRTVGRADDTARPTVRVGPPTRPNETAASIAANRSVQAQTAVAKHILKEMLYRGSVGKDHAGRLFPLRPIQRTQGLDAEQIVTDPAVIRADVARREALRAIGEVRESITKPATRMPLNVRLLLTGCHSYSNLRNIR